MYRDTDQSNPKISWREALADFEANKANLKLSEFGYNFIGNDNPFWEAFAKVLSPGDLVPVQIASGPLLSMRYITPPSPHCVKAALDKKIKLFVHLPFVISPYREGARLTYVADYLVNLTAMYCKAGITDIDYILHACSFPQPNLKMDDTHTLWAMTETFVSNIKNWIKTILLTNNWSGNILLENLSGSRMHTFLVTGIAFLYMRYFNKFMDTRNSLNLFKGEQFESHVGLCLDTEHSWALGDSFPDLKKLFEIPEFVSKIKLIHMNAAPEIAEWGKHIDLHSYTTFAVDTDRNHMWSLDKDKISDSVWDLREFLRLSKGIPKVFERCWFPTQLDDHKFLSSL